MRIKLDPWAYMPERAHDTDAGLDLKTPKDIILPFTEGYKSAGSVVIDTGVHIELPHGYYGKIESKSGLNVKHEIVSCGGVIDEGYTGSICVKLYNLGKRCYVFRAGDKIAQLVIQPYITPVLELVNDLGHTDRGDSGFGSTGR